MGKQGLEEKLESLAALRQVGERPVLEAALRKALRDKNNYYVAKAAELVGEMGLGELAGELVEAFDRFLVDGAKRDPKCWAKEAIVKALGELGHRGAAVYRKGLGHVQMEAVWGGEADAAAGLRSVCAMRLVETDLPDLEVLDLLSVALADAEPRVRGEVARALGQLGCREALPLLRFKALSGDREVEVVGHCLAGILEVGGEGEVAWVGRFLDAPDEEVRAEAASVLAFARFERAGEELRRYWKQMLPEELRTALLVALGASPQRQAATLLASIVEDGDEPLRRVAMAREELRRSRFAGEFGDLLDEEK